MNIKILHFYPDLMSLYGSYANVSIVRRTLEQMGNSITVERVLPGAPADLSDADLAALRNREIGFGFQAFQLRMEIKQQSIQGYIVLS